MSTENAVFRRLLGAAFERLDAPLQRMHGGNAGEYQGTAGVERGSAWLAQLACHIARLPRDVSNTPLRFRLETDGGRETWTRYFSGSRPMVSRLWPDRGFLAECLGPATLRFVLSEQGGALLWRAESLRVLGIAVPRRLFDFQARVHGEGDRYHFEINARLALVGRLIRYRGVLHVVD